MSKEETKLDKNKQDNDLSELDAILNDLNSDEFNFDLGNDKRTPITKIKSGVKRALNPKNQGVVGSVLNNLVTKALPDSYGTTVREFSSISNDIRRTLSEAKTELNPTFNEAKNLTAQNIGRLEKFLPKKLVNRLKENLNVEESNYSYASRDLQAEGLEQTLTSVFNKQNNLHSTQLDLAVTNSIIGQKQSHRQFKFTAAAQSSMASSLAKLAGYQDQITDKYYRKSLELQFRQYWTTKELLETNREASYNVLNELKAITRNTGLPDTIKVTNSELLKHKHKNMIAGRLNEFATNQVNTLLGNFRKNFVAGARNTNDYFSTLTGSLPNAGMDFYAEHGAGMLRDYLAGKVGSGIKKKLPEWGERISPKYFGKEGSVTKKIRHGADYAENLADNWKGNILNKVNKAQGEGIWGVVGKMMDYDPERTERVNRNLASDATEPVPWDLLSRRSLIEIIPGLLTRNLHRLTDVYESLSGTSNNERPVYNPLREKFSSEATFRKDTKERFTIKMNSRVKDLVNQIIDYVDDPNDPFTPEQRVRFGILLAKDASKKISFDPRNYTAGNFLTKIDDTLADKISNSVKKAFEIQEVTSKDEFGLPSIKQKIGRSYESNYRLNKISKLFNDSGRGLDSAQDVYTLFNALGQKDFLERMGVLKNGRINPEYNEQLLYELITGTGNFGTSSARNKQFTPKTEKDRRSEFEKRTDAAKESLGYKRKKKTEYEFSDEDSVDSEFSTIKYSKTVRRSDRPSVDQSNAINFDDEKQDSFSIENNHTDFKFKPNRRYRQKSRYNPQFNNASKEQNNDDTSLLDSIRITLQDIKNSVNGLFAVQATKSDDVPTKQLSDFQYWVKLLKIPGSVAKKILKTSLSLNKAARPIQSGIYGAAGTLFKLTKKITPPAINSISSGLKGLGRIGLSNLKNIPSNASTTLSIMESLMSNIGLPLGKFGFKHGVNIAKAGTSGLFNLLGYGLRNAPSNTATVGRIVTRGTRGIFNFIKYGLKGKPVDGEEPATKADLLMGEQISVLNKIKDAINGIHGDSEDQEANSTNGWRSIWKKRGEHKDATKDKDNTDSDDFKAKADKIQNNLNQGKQNAGPTFTDKLGDFIKDDGAEVLGAGIFAKYLGGAKGLWRKTKGLLGKSFKTAGIADGVGSGASTMSKVIKGGSMLKSGLALSFLAYTNSVVDNVIEKSRESTLKLSTTPSNFELLKLLQYGTPIANKYAIKTIRVFEDFFQRYITLKDNGSMSVKLTEDEIWDKFGADFGNDITDPNNRKRFFTWLRKRFLPVWIKHTLTQRLFKVNGKSIVNPELLDATTINKYLSCLDFAGAEAALGLTPLSVTDSPWKDIELGDNEDLIKMQFDNIRSIADSKKKSDNNFLAKIQKAATDKDNILKQQKEKYSKVKTDNLKQYVDEKEKDQSFLDKIKDWSKVNLVNRFNTYSDTAKDIYNNLGTYSKKAMGYVSTGVKTAGKWVNTNVVEPISNSLAGLIQKAESGGKGYNAYNRGTLGNKILGPVGPKDLTKMTIAEILSKMALPVTDPDRLFAVGKYQIIPSSLKEAIKVLGIDPTTTLFDKETQERIFAGYLIDKKRKNISAYIKGKTDNLLAAASDAAAEWASIADPKTGVSRYGHGNKASVSADQITSALSKARGLYQQYIAQGKSEDEAYQLAAASDSASDFSNSNIQPAKQPLAFKPPVINKAPTPEQITAPPTTQESVDSQPISNIANNLPTITMPDLSPISKATYDVASNASSQRDAHLKEARMQTNLLTQLLEKTTNSQSNNILLNTNQNQNKQLKPVIQLQQS